MAARSLAMSTMDYFWGVQYLWYAVSTKIARSVGEGDAVAIAKVSSHIVNCRLTYAGTTTHSVAWRGSFSRCP